MSYTVYMHTCPNGKKYIGLTCQIPERRWGNGFKYKFNKHFYNAIKKYGWANIEHKIMSNWHTKEEAEKLEQLLIEKYQTNNCKYGYNKTSGGETGKRLSQETKDILRQININNIENTERLRRLGKARIGTKQSEETIQKRIRNLIGKKRSAETIEKIRQKNIGKIRSDEIRKKMSVLKKGKKLSEEHRKNVINALKGRVCSEETRKKISDCQKGKNLHPENIEKLRLLNTGRKQSEETKKKRALKLEKKIYQYSISGSYINTYDSINKAYECLNKKPTGAITDCCRKRSKTAYGYRWEYAEDTP